jgi:ribosomal protein S18 acetylase RimI-like enzyme
MDALENDDEHAQRPALPIEIREMELEDLGAVFHLGERLFTADQVPNLYRTWDEYEVTDLFRSDPELCLVAEQGDEIVGFTLATTIDKRRSAWKYGYLVWLGVEPAFARAGLGARLFRLLRHRMEQEGVRMILVDTEAGNEAALRFFRKLGFTNPHEHVFLSLNLSTPKRRNGAEATASTAASAPSSPASARDEAPSHPETGEDE